MNTNLLTGGRRHLDTILVLVQLDQRPTAVVVGTTGRQQESLPSLFRVQALLGRPGRPLEQRRSKCVHDLTRRHCLSTAPV